jgi:hypothetical protein
MEQQDVLSIDDQVMASRYADRVEAAAYFCCVEALTHATGHLDVAVRQEGADLALRMHGVDLDGMDRLAVLDRVEACEGRLEMVRMHGQVALRITLPTVSVTAPASGP